MYFPVAGIEVSWWIPPLAAFVVSFFTSMGGVSGAFLLLPLQMSFLGYTAPSVSATNHLFNIVAIPSGVRRYSREKRMVWPLAWAVALGTLPGVILGVFIRVLWLPDPKNFKIFAGLLMACIGVRMAVDLLGRKGAQRCEASQAGQVGAASISAHSIQYTCSGATYACSTRTIFTLCLAIGVAGGAYGIGGGSIVAPFLVSVCGLPVHTVAGAALMGTLVTSVVGVVFFQILALFHAGQGIAPDWMLGFLFGLGGMCGMYCGARMQKFVPAQVIKAMLCVVVLGTAIKYLLDFF